MTLPGRPSMRDIAVRLALGACALAAPASQAAGRAEGRCRLSGWTVSWDGEKSLAAALRHAGRMDEVSVFAADFDHAYRLQRPAWAAGAARALKRADPKSPPRVLLTVVNDVRRRDGTSILKDHKCVAHWISTPGRMRDHIEDLVRLSDGFDGIEIDYESMRLENRTDFSAFISLLAGALHARGKTLSVVVEPKTSDVLKHKAGAIDWKAVGAAADGVKVMAYLFHAPSGKAGPIAPKEWVAAVARFALTQIPRDKLSIALTLNGCDWAGPGKGKSIDHEAAMALAAARRADLRWDAVSSSPHFRYTGDDGLEHEVWFEDVLSLREKVRRLQEEGIQRIALWRLGVGDPAFRDWAFSAD